MIAALAPQQIQRKPRAVPLGTFRRHRYRYPQFGGYIYTTISGMSWVVFF